MYYSSVFLIDDIFFFKGTKKNRNLFSRNQHHKG